MQTARIVLNRSQGGTRVQEKQMIQKNLKADSKGLLQSLKLRPRLTTAPPSGKNLSLQIT